MRHTASISQWAERIYYSTKSSRPKGAGTVISSARKKISWSSLRWNDIEFYFDFVFDLNSSACDAYGSYAEGGLLE